MSRPQGPIRVLELIGTMHIGGAERVVAHLMRGADPAAFEMHLCCTRQMGVVAEALVQDGYDVQLAATRNPRWRHLTPLFVQRVIAKLRPHVIHTHSTPSLIHVGPSALFGLTPPWAHTFHFGNYPLANAREMRQERFFCRQPSQLVAVSDSQRASIITHHGVDPGRIRTLENGVEPNAYLADPSVREARRREFGFTADDIVIGSIAVLSKQKGVTHFLTAAKTLAERDNRLRFLVAGGGPSEQELRQQAADIGLGSRVVFTGWRDDATALMTAVDVYVMASLWEAMPLALLEAMAARRPIVVTDVADNRRIVADGGCAIVVPPADPAAIVEAVQRLVADPAAAAAMATRAHERFGAHFTVPHMVKRYEALFAELARP